MKNRLIRQSIIIVALLATLSGMPVVAAQKLDEAAAGVYTIDNGVTMPQLLQKTTPGYTDDAIEAKVEGIVTLQAVLRKNGRVDSFKVLSGPGYGLEEEAIQEISSNWRFRPGTLNGRPVDVMITIEVQFNLR